MVIQLLVFLIQYDLFRVVYPKYRDKDYLNTVLKKGYI